MPPSMPPALHGAYLTVGGQGHRTVPLPPPPLAPPRPQSTNGVAAYMNASGKCHPMSMDGVGEACTAGQRAAGQQNVRQALPPHVQAQLTPAQLRAEAERHATQFLQHQVPVQEIMNAQARQQAMLQEISDNRANQQAALLQEEAKKQAATFAAQQAFIAEQLAAAKTKAETESNAKLMADAQTAQQQEMAL